MSEIIEIGFDGESPDQNRPYFTVRPEVEEFKYGGSVPLVDICILAYNKFSERTRVCLKYLFKYTRPELFHLILIDNGSTDETLERFNELPFEEKTIIHMERNLGPTLAEPLVRPYLKGQFYVRMGNDVFVTPNWLDNLLNAMCSDSSFGVVFPCITNSALYQKPEIPEIETLDELETLATEYNKASDPLKWEERVITLPSLCMIRRSCLDAIGDIWDTALVDYSDMDFSIRVRRAGYRIIICKDTFVHHNHAYNNSGEVSPDSISLKKFKTKNPGMHPWLDYGSFNPLLRKSMDKPASSGPFSLLGIDVQCGSQLMEIKNQLHNFGIDDCVMSAFTSDSKYATELRLMCGENVKSGNISLLVNEFDQNSFDYIVFGGFINAAMNVKDVLRQAARLLKPGGSLLFEFANVFSVPTFCNILLGQKSNTFSGFCSMSFSDLISYISELGFTDAKSIVQSSPGDLQTIAPLIAEILKILQFSSEDNKKVIENISVRSWAFSVKQPG